MRSLERAAGAGAADLLGRHRRHLLAAALLGILLGVAVSYSRTLMQAVYPTIVFFQLIPKVALAPVFLLWFGTGFAANVIFSVFIAFFPVRGGDHRRPAGRAAQLRDGCAAA